MSDRLLKSIQGATHDLAQALLLIGCFVVLAGIILSPIYRFLFGT